MIVPPLFLFLASLLGAVLFALIDRGLANFFCWYRRRQAQRRAAQEKEECGCARLMAAVAQEERRKRIQEDAAKRATDKLNSIPFMVEPDTFQVGILCSREIVLHLQAQDTQRFVVLEQEGGQAN